MSTTASVTAAWEVLGPRFCFLEFTLVCLTRSGGQQPVDEALDELLDLRIGERLGPGRGREANQGFNGLQSPKSLHLWVDFA